MKALAPIGLRSAPGLAVSMWTMNEIVAFLTGAFLVLQIAHFLWKWWQELHPQVPQSTSPRTKADA